jgi:hypothetical protein
MQLTPQTLYRFAEVIQTFEQLSTVTGTRPPAMVVEVVLDDQPNALLGLQWVVEDEETGDGHFAITRLDFREEGDPGEDVEEPTDAESQAEAQAILERFMKSFQGLGAQVEVIDASSFFATPGEEEPVEELVPAEDDGEE